LPRYIYGEDPASQNDFFGIVIHEIPTKQTAKPIDDGLIFQPREQSVREDDCVANGGKDSPGLISVRHVFGI